MKRFVMAAGLFIAAAAPAFAQEGSRVTAIGGITFQTQSDALIGGEFGGNLHPNLEVYGGVNFMRNVLPRNIQADLDVASALLTETTGNVWQLKADIRALTGVGGVRYRMPMAAHFRPYVLAGGGIANIKMRIRERDLGVMPQDVLEQMGLNQSTDTKPYLELGGGIEVPAGRLVLDAGYKFGRFVGNTNVNTSRVYFGVGTRF
jgi:opacity protein-like surface antigen